MDLTISKYNNLIMGNGVRYTKMKTVALQRFGDRIMSDDTRFRLWKKRVDRYVYGSIGMHLDDLPDHLYRCMHDEKITPLRVASIVIRDSFDFEL